MYLPLCTVIMSVGLFSLCIPTYIFLSFIPFQKKIYFSGHLVRIELTLKKHTRFKFHRLNQGNTDR